MMNFETINRLRDIPMIRSSTEIAQDLYTKAKGTSVFIRVPCNIAEVVADKSFRIASSVATPFVKPFSGPVRAIDQYAAGKIRQMERKYPVITTTTEEVFNSFNEKTEPVRQVMNNVKNSTASTIQHGKETVSNVADSVFSMCGSQTSTTKRTGSYQQKGKSGCVSTNVSCLLNFALQTAYSTMVWFRLFLQFVLFRVKQANDFTLKLIQRNTCCLGLPQKFLIYFGVFLDFVINYIRPDDRVLEDLRKTKQQPQVVQRPPFFTNRHSLKPDPSVPVRQSVVTTRQETVITNTTGSDYLSRTQFKTTEPDYSNMTDAEELHARLATPFTPSIDEIEYTDNSVRNPDIAQLHQKINPRDVELLYSKLPADIIESEDRIIEPLTADQEKLRQRVLGTDGEYGNNFDDDYVQDDD